MSTLGRVMAFYPLGLVALLAGAIGWMLEAPGLAPTLAIAFVLYGLPVLSFRIHERFHPVRPGASYIGGNQYCPWWGAHQIQLIYIACPQLEAFLRLVPGLYSQWLRAWGSRVGRNVHWTPLVEITDRSLMDIGHDVVFGHRSGTFGHVIKPTHVNMLLYVKPVRIGDGAFIGAGAYLGPGVRVADGALVPAGAHLFPNRVVEACDPR